MKKTLITLALTMVSSGVFAQMDNSNMNHENMEHGQMDHGSMNMDKMPMDHGKMNHGKMDHSGMSGMPGMSALVCLQMAQNQTKSFMYS